MRKILLEHSDYDRFNQETWTDVQPGLLMTPKIVLTSTDEGLWLYCFSKDIEKDSPSALAKQATIIALHIDGASLKGYDLEEIANMPLVGLARILAAQI